MKWEKVPFSEVIKDITGGNKKFVSTEYNTTGLFPIIDQGDSFIGGYTNESCTVNRIKPVVIFGDHTKKIKYVDFDFCLGADGVKVLSTTDNLLPKYFYYYLLTLNLPDVGYSRHFKFLKEYSVPLPPLEVQKQIADTLDKADELRKKDELLLKKYDELAQSIFYDMFGDPVKNEKGWEVKKLDYLVSIKPKTIKPIDTNDYEYIGLENIEKGTGRLSYSKETDLKSNKFLFDDKTILYGKLRPYLRKVGLPSSLGICSTDILPIQCKTVDKYFICSILRSNNFTDYATTNSVGANLPRVNKETILSFETINPPFELQSIYGKKIQIINESKESVYSTKSKTETLFQTFLNTYFS